MSMNVERQASNMMRSMGYLKAPTARVQAPVKMARVEPARKIGR